MRFRRKYRNDLKVGDWGIYGRVGDYGDERLYMSRYDVTSGYISSSSLGATRVGADGVPENAFLSLSGSLEDYLPSVGDLVVVKCDLQFVSAGISFPNNYFLPGVLKDKFIMVDIVNHERKLLEETKYIPTLTLNVFLDIDGMLELTAYDYEESMTDTKRWDMREHGGLRLIDYVSKRSKVLDGNGFSMFLSDDSVDFHQIAFKDTDLITNIPGLVETRRQKHWFFNNWNNNIYRSGSNLTSETYVKFPLVGLVGTLLDFKVVTHSLTADGQYVGGKDFKTIFYKVLFNGRIPVWVDAPLWKCPDSLDLPILLPIP